jgi:hypothetical protein
VVFDPVLEVADDDVVEVEPDVADVALDSDLRFDPQAAATVTSPAPASNWSARRRSTRVGRSSTSCSVCVMR